MAKKPKSVETMLAAALKRVGANPVPSQVLDSRISPRDPFSAIDTSRYGVDRASGSRSVTTKSSVPKKPSKKPSKKSAQQRPVRGDSHRLPAEVRMAPRSVVADVVPPEQMAGELRYVPRPYTVASEKLINQLAQTEVLIEQAEQKKGGIWPSNVVSSAQVAELLRQGYTPEQVVDEFMTYPPVAGFGGVERYQNTPSVLEQVQDRLRRTPDVKRRPRRLARWVGGYAVYVAITYPLGFWAGDTVRDQDDLLSIGLRAAGTGINTAIENTPVVRDVAEIVNYPLEAYFHTYDDVTDDTEGE